MAVVCPLYYRHCGYDGYYGCARLHHGYTTAVHGYAMAVVWLLCLHCADDGYDGYYGYYSHYGSYGNYC
jgi:hypothetical protein